MIVTERDPCNQWVRETFGTSGIEFVQAIGYEKDGFRCVTGYNHINGKSCHVHFYHVGGYVSKNYLWFIHYYPFIQLGLDMLIAITSNAKMLSLCNKLGYNEQHRLENAHPDGDLIILTLSKADCRFI